MLPLIVFLLWTVFILWDVELIPVLMVIVLIAVTQLFLWGLFSLIY